MKEKERASFEDWSQNNPDNMISRFQKPYSFHPQFPVCDHLYPKQNKICPSQQV